MHLLKIFIDALIGNMYKIKVLFLLLLNIRPKQSDFIAENVIVSLTSYGDRVFKCAIYSVFSILSQSVSPEKVILWLDKTKWNQENIPFLLKRMCTWDRFEIKFCEDMRSFTKLIPALIEYPDKIIITIDDDIYYSHHLIEKLYQRHREFPKKICALSCCIPEFETNGNICTYSHWKEYRRVNSRQQLNENLLMPQGFGGVLYPPSAFDKDILDKEVFMKICPMADDIWFYVMSIKNKTLRTWVPNSGIKSYNVDLFRQIITRDRLHDKNVGEKKNDIQLQDTLDYYGLKLTICNE